MTTFCEPELLSRGYVLIPGQSPSQNVAFALAGSAQERVAIKRIELEEGDEEGYAAVLRQLRVLRLLGESDENPFIVAAREVFLVRQPKNKMEVYIVTEFAGIDLATLLRRRQSKLAEPTIVKILHGILLAVRFLHSAKLIHRKIEPSNILIDDEMNVKVCGLSQVRFYEKKLKDYSGLPRRQIDKMIEKAHSRRAKRPREMSPHVGQRHYRSPEIILMEPRYNQKADVWAVGCIAAELALHMYLPKEEWRPFFEGDFCFPMSPKVYTPKHSNNDPVDQLCSIFERLGLPQESSLSFISCPHARQYAEETALEATVVSAFDFKREFAGLDENLTELMENMLGFNPYYRYSVDKLLESPLFDEKNDRTILCNQNFSEAGKLERPMTEQAFLHVKQDLAVEASRFKAIP